MPDNSALDMLVKSASEPALSATTDMPAPVEKNTLENPPAQDNPSDKAAPDGEIQEPSASSDDPSGDDPAASAEPTASKPSKGVQKRIDELIRQRGEAERLAADQAKRLDDAMAIIQKMTGARDNQPTTAPQADAKPARDQFDDPEAFTEALVSWSSRQAIKNYQAEQQQQAEKSRQQEDFQKVTKAWSDGREKAIEKYPDYDEVVSNSSLAIAQHVGFAVVAHEHAHDIAYWLGKHPEEAARISSLSPVLSAQAIGVIGERLATAKPEVSKAPEPVKPIGSRNDASAKTPDEESMDEYAARRNASLRKARTKQ